MPTVSLGNVDHVTVLTDPETGIKTRTKTAHVVRSITVMHISEPDLFAQMRDVINLWRDQSDSKPAWLTAGEPALEAALVQHFGLEAAGQPEGWTNEFMQPGQPAGIETVGGES